LFIIDLHQAFFQYILFDLTYICSKANMTLTLVVGSEPGSGKTALLNDIYKKQGCTYIRQNYAMRPYLKVSDIRNFDPQELPYWKIYKKAGTEANIKVGGGGTVARERMAEGLSEGQRKLLYLEILCQRTEGRAGLLILLDEPLAGMTDDLVPYFLDSLNDMRHRHNVVVASSLRVDELKQIANNVIKVSATDRTFVRLNGADEVDRKKIIAALAVGQKFDMISVKDDVLFFFDVEILSNKGLLGLAIFSVCFFSMSIAALWNSDQSNAPLVLVAGGLISYSSVYHYLLSFVEWRNIVGEEVDALVHGSKHMSKTLKTLLAILIIIVLSLMQFTVVSTVMDGMSSVNFWVAMLFDNISLIAPFICLGLYTRMSVEAVRVICSLPFMLMILFSSTFSPGSGVAGFRELRYIFPRFYFWCMVPSIQGSMEGCPQEDYQIMLSLILCAFLGLSLFLVPMVLLDIRTQCIINRQALQDQKNISRSATPTTKDKESMWLQTELYGGAQTDRGRGLERGHKHHFPQKGNHDNAHGLKELMNRYLPEKPHHHRQPPQVKLGATTDGLQESQHSGTTNNSIASSEAYSLHSFRIAV
jgi:energy-coupling factor transporter ATP-binding protein EcfA2